MTIAELQAALDQVNAERFALNAKAREISGQLVAAQAAEAARERVANMSPAERAALAAEIAAVGNAA